MKTYKSPFHRVRGELISSDVFTGLGYTRTRTILKNGTATNSDTQFSTIYTPPAVGDRMTDIVTPAFASLRSKGFIINNPMEKVIRTNSIWPWSGNTSQTTQKNPVNPTSVAKTEYSWSNYCLLPSDTRFSMPSIPSIRSVEAEAINDAFAKSHQKGVMGLVDLVEGPKTVQLLKTQLQRLDTLLRGARYKKMNLKRLKRSNVKVLVGDSFKEQARKGVGDISGLWLEYHYGILPTMMSIEGLIAALSEIVLPERQTFRGFSKMEDRLVNTYTQDRISGSPELGTQTFECVNEYKYSVRAGVTTTFKPTMNQRLGLTLADTGSTIYELIHLSFVLDWFVDIGGYLEAITPVHGYNFLASWMTTELRQTKTWQYQAFAGSKDTTSYHTDTYNVGPTLYAEFNYVKKRTPGVTPRIPSLNTQFRSIRHLISGAALLVSSAATKQKLRI